MSFVFKNKHSNKELALISENLGLLYRDGISITKSLELLLELPLSARYKKSIIEIQNRVNIGEPLSQAFGYYDKLYPKIFIGLLSVGENSGKLTEVLTSLSIFYGRIDKTKREIVNALIYPGILIILIGIIFMILVLFIVPTLLEAYSAVGRELPKSSEILYKINEGIRANPIGSLIYIISWGLIIPYMIIKAMTPYIKENIIYNLKFSKSIIEYLFILVFSVIASSGVSLQIGLGYCIQSINISIVREGLRKINRDILSGRDLSSSLKDIKFFSKYTLSIITLGEESGSMDERLIYLEKRMSEKSLDKLKMALSYVQPSIILAMAVFIGIFIMIFVAPLFDTMYNGAF